jgi:DNA-binding MarR family transcriptional regulator
MSHTPLASDPVGIAATDLAPRLRLALVRLARRLRSEQADAGLTPSMASALASIERAGPISLGELAAVEQLAPPSLTRIVGRLEDAGLVERVIDAADRRIARVEITDVGRRLLHKIRSRKTAFLARRLSKLTDDERAVLADALPLLEALLDGDVR